ncbi:hypothetical protein GBA63_19705 [Rubrobacter tropicus]|uniref:Uncharacterized protein n=1 Tax=Rubrobacter tropicus TaxID=2653851 RepID=A0A6G8QDQ4_9ACTN|nr:hypothetical protein [Rubrobacter tropicus]QIN84626.1 hypothetical protein GBA63_19705 [Rubrobacter tropicus]
MQARHTQTPEVGRRGDTLRGPFWRSVGRKVLSACGGPAAAVNRELPRYLFWALVASLVASVVLGVGAGEALAQQQGGQGGGDAISQTLDNVRNYLAGLAFGVGGIGFVASLLVKGYASINENAHAYAAMGMKGSLWCIVAGVIVTPILTIASGLAAGGGGG